MSTTLRRIALLLCVSATAFATPGCFAILPPAGVPFGGTMFEGFGTVIWGHMAFWETLPLTPVPSYFSQQVEDAYWEEERYGKVPVLDPVEGENAPLFCLDPPTPDEVIRSLPDTTEGGVPFLAETQRNNVRIVVEPIVDRIDDCRFFPMVGPARLHHCHYKCTVYYDKVLRSDWPVPFTHQDETKDVVYIDHDHLIRCAGPPTPR